MTNDNIYDILDYKDEEVIKDYDLWCSLEFQGWARKFILQDPTWLNEEEVRRIAADILQYGK